MVLVVSFDEIVTLSSAFMAVRQVRRTRSGGTPLVNPNQTTEPDTELPVPHWLIFDQV